MSESTGDHLARLRKELKEPARDVDHLLGRRSPEHQMLMIKFLECAAYQNALKVIAEGRADPDAPTLARRTLQETCEKCSGQPPAGFTCNECGAAGS